MKLCTLYEELGVPLGPLVPATVAGKERPVGAIVLALPSAIADRWARRLAGSPSLAWPPAGCACAARARQGGVELPMVISDHADWPELLATCAEVQAEEIWVTHGREEALIHALGQGGICGRALHLVGRGEGEEE